MGTSAARRAFGKSCEDIDRLLKIHSDISGPLPGRKHGVLVLNKSAFVLITAFWEAYCEDIAAEGLKHLVDHAPAASALPAELQKIVAKELKLDKHDLAIWQLADDGWRSVLSVRLATLQANRNRRLNTPKTAEIDDLFLSTVGVNRISSRWYWQGMAVDKARTKLDDFVTLRGQIAHRGQASGKPSKFQVEDYYGHVKRIVGKTGGAVNSAVKKATGKEIWST